MYIGLVLFYNQSAKQLYLYYSKVLNVCLVIECVLKGAAAPPDMLALWQLLILFIYNITIIN
jgi:hypothetical protein